MATKRTNNGKEMTKPAQRTFETRTDIEADARQQLIELCNRQLAATFDLYSQNKHAHWNVKGKDFFQLHELFDTLAEEVLPYVDMIAERITALGGVAQGTLRRAAGATELNDFPEDVHEGMQVVDTIANCYANVAASTRRAIDEAEQAGDMGTSDMFTEIVRTLDKHLYFLESHLQA
jgi:starvation-inducible DNA-binding protein